MNIELITYTPEPESVCNLGAKVCVSENMPESGWDDFKALDHAVASGHESVLEHATFTFAIEGISRASSHQLVRHRMASYSQQSQRYVRMDGFELVYPQSVMDASGAESGWERDGTIAVAIKDYLSDLKWLVDKLRKANIPEEDIRYFYPNATKTNIIVTMNARELRHFFSLRCCERAQWEIKQVAEMMLALVKEVAPSLFENAGAQCMKLGYCPEKRGCGKYSKKVKE